MLVIDAVGGARLFRRRRHRRYLQRHGLRATTTHARRILADGIRLERRAVPLPKPVATFLQGFTMGGGVGVGCHASHRIVGETSRIAMPECGIGLISGCGWLACCWPAHRGGLGEYLGTTSAYRMASGRRDPCGVCGLLRASRGRVARADRAALKKPATQRPLIDQRRRSPAPPASTLADTRLRLTRHFGGETLRLTS